VVTGGVVSPGDGVLVGVEVGVREWQERALCARPDVDGAWWFSADPVAAALALAVCGRCPVRAACGVAADGEVDGIWAGVARAPYLAAAVRDLDAGVLADAVAAVGVRRVGAAG